MKITLDIPDTTICAFFNFVYRSNKFGLLMNSAGIISDKLYDGSEIKIEVPEDTTHTEVEAAEVWNRRPKDES